MLLSVGYTHEEVIYILVFYTIGSLLGFFSFRHSTKKGFKENFCTCIVTVGTGIFLSYILSNYLEEKQIFSKSMNMLVGGLCSFGIPDIIITYWPIMKRTLLRVIYNKIGKKYGVEVNDNRK